MTRWRLKLLFLAGALWLMAGDIGWPLEFVAERVTRVDGQSRRSNVYYRDGLSRVEHNEGGLVDVTIARKDKGLIWLLLARTRQFQTIAYQDNRGPMVTRQLEGEIQREEIGTETVNGHRTTVYRVTVETSAGQAKTFYQWFATDLGLPLRLASRDNDWMTEYTNAKLTRIPDFMFNLPRHYQPAQDTR